MYIRPKTKRRLVILGSAFALIMGILVIGYVIRDRRIDALIADARTRAMTANATGDHREALEAFRFYLDETKTADKPPAEADAEAVLAYAKSRAAVETDKGRHLFEAVKILERYLRLRPEDGEARRMLLELQPRIGYNDEALQLADEILARNPDDADALRARVRALRNKGTQDRQFYVQALASAEHLAKVRPDDLRAQAEVLRLMTVTRRPDADVVARAQSLREAHPGDPRFDLLLATAHLLVRQPEPAAAALKAAAGAKALPDAAFVLELSRQLDAFGLFPLAQDVIERGAAAFPDDAELTRAAAWRLWQSGRYDEVVRRCALVDPAKGDPTLLALRALSISAALPAKRGEAAHDAEALGNRQKDSAAAAWAAILSAQLATGGVEPSKVSAQYRSAAERDPQNPVAPLLLGEAYARMGELELAADAWQSAARLAPSWAAPHARLARAAIDAGRYADAVRAAEAAYRRAPRDISAAADWVVASYGLLRSKRSADASATSSLLSSAEAVQKDVPGEPRTLPIYVALLADAGRKDDAVKAARAVIAAPKPDADLLSRLAVVIRTHALGLDAELATLSASDAIATPATTFRAAALLLQSGQVQPALDSMNAAKAKAVAAGGSALSWEVATLELRDLADDGSTVGDWATVADANPKDLAVQSAVLRSPARSRDRELWQRAVARVKALTGPEGHLWQIEQARLALAGDSGGDELSAAIALLESVTKSAATSAEPRRLLALAYERRSRERSGDERRAALARALEEIAKAADLRPGDSTIARDLVAISRAAGENERAVQFLDRVSEESAGRVDASTRAWVADAYAELGEFEKAARLLEGSQDATGTTSRLAGLRRRQGDVEGAATLYRKLLAATDTDAPMLIEAAEYFTDRGDVATAQQFITKLTALPLKPGTIEIIRGRFQERRGLNDEALSAYRAATAVQGAGPAAWREFSGFLLRQRRFADAVAAADGGLKAAAGDAWLTALRDRAKVFQSLPDAMNAGEAPVDALLVAISTDPTNDAAIQMQRLMEQRARVTSENLRAAADRFLQFMPLQYWAVRESITTRQFAPAEQIARRAARTRPDDPEAARLLATALVAQDNWAKAKPAALTWRALAWRDTLPADLLVAECQIETGDPAGAVERLNGYLTGTARDDLRFNALLARAMITAGRADDAATLLEARAAREPAWRKLWLSLAPRHGERAAAEAWITRIAPRISAELSERKALAEAWLAVGHRFGAPEACRNAFDAISAVPVANLDPDSQALLAVCAQAVGNYDVAVAAHRAVLASNPQLPEAKNNLAYALMLRGRAEDLSEAKPIAVEAVTAKPDNATFRDTLARVHARAGNLDAAVAEFRTALQTEPYHLEARLGLADALTVTSQRDEARLILAALEKDLRLAPALPSYLAGQLESVRKALAKP